MLRPFATSLLATFILAMPPLRAQALAGVILDSISQKPIVGARLVLLDSTGTALAVAVTSTDGEFAFRLPRLGEYRLLVTRIGYPAITTKRFIVDSAFTAESRWPYPQLR
jgi:hypothetical protein